MGKNKWTMKRWIESEHTVPGITYLVTDYRTMTVFAIRDTHNYAMSNEIFKNSGY